MEHRLKKYHQQLNIMGNCLDDDQDLLEDLTQVFKNNGFDDFKFYFRPDDLLENLNSNVHICIIDENLQEAKTGVDVINAVKKTNPDCWFIGFTGTTDRQKLRAMTNAGCRRLVDKNEPDYDKELVKYVQEAINIIKDDFEWHASLLKKIQSYEAKQISL